MMVVGLSLHRFDGTYIQNESQLVTIDQKMAAVNCSFSPHYKVYLSQGKVCGPLLLRLYYQMVSPELSNSLARIYTYDETMSIKAVMCKGGFMETAVRGGHCQMFPLKFQQEFYLYFIHAGTSRDFRVPKLLNAFSETHKKIIAIIFITSGRRYANAWGTR
jgi:hypothetical protein